MIIDTISTSIFFKEMTFFSVVGFLFHCQLCVGLHFKGFTIFCDITYLCFISYPTQENFINLCLIYFREKINFHVWFDDIFSRCIIFYFGLTCWQLVTNQAIAGFCIYMYLCNNESKWESQGEIQALLIYFYRTAWHWALICDVDNEIVRNRDVYI